jgi:hypothetical protein
MLDIHPNAAENYNKKANHLLTFIRDIEPSKEQFPSFNPRIHSKILIDKSIFLNAPIHRVKNINNDTTRLYMSSNLSIGIIEDGCLELTKLTKSMFTDKKINHKVSIKTLDLILCTWIIAKFADSSHCSFLEFLRAYLEEKICEYEIVIPIEFLHIERSFVLGNINFKPFSKESIDEIESRAIEQVKDQEDLTRTIFDENIRKFQGYAVASILLEAEPRRAYEIAIEETNLALSMLRIFSTSTQEPLSYYPCAVWGSSNINRGYLIALKEGKFNQICNTTLDRRPIPEYLDNQAIDDLYKEGLSIIDDLLRLSKRNPFQKKLLDVLIIYSRNTVLKDITDKLIYILTALESIFLRNTNEPIQQNLGERIAFLIENSLEKRKRIIRITRDTYALRSRFVHHGSSIKDEDIEIMREFMKYAWQAIIQLIHSSDSITTPQALLDKIDDIKLS